MTSQKQDLSFFNDNSILPHKTLSQEHLFGFITHTQGTSPSWLINLLIENALYGTCAINHEKTQVKSNKTEVFVVSFLQNLEFYEKDLRKNGIEISDNKHFHFIDAFTDLFQKDLKKFLEDIVKQISSISTPLNKVVFIEGIEFLLAATLSTPLSLLKEINKIHRASSSLFIISHTDKELIEVTSHNQDSPEFKTVDFLIRIVHRANLNIALRPLDTGRAKDITGTLTISRGTIPYNSADITEKEYLYLISKDQNVKLFFR